MITFHVHCRLRDGMAEEAERLITNLVATVEREEPDAALYSFFRSAADPQVIVLLESYVSNEAFLAHNSSPYMVAFRERFSELFDPSTNEVTMLKDIAGFDRAWPGVMEVSLAAAS